MNVLIEFVMFVLMLPALLLYMAVSMFRAAADFFGWTYVPGLLGLYLGALLLAFGQPDPNTPWQNIFQTLAGITLAGIAMPQLLILAGAGILALGTALHLKGKVGSK